MNIGNPGFYDLVTQGDVSNGSTITLISGFSFAWGRENSGQAFPRFDILPDELPDIPDGQTLTAYFSLPMTQLLALHRQKCNYNLRQRAIFQLM
jgi:hypothetical protein